MKGELEQPTGTFYFTKAGFPVLAPQPVCPLELPASQSARDSISNDPAEPGAIAERRAAGGSHPLDPGHPATRLRRRSVERVFRRPEVVARHSRRSPHFLKKKYFGKISGFLPYWY